LKRPQFDDFRELFLDCLRHDFKIDEAAIAEKKWLELGDAEYRRTILETLNKKLKKKNGIEFQINRRLLCVEGPVKAL
jgi:hypothetical protein